MATGLLLAQGVRDVSYSTVRYGGVANFRGQGVLEMPDGTFVRQTGYSTMGNAQVLERRGFLEVLPIVGDPAIRGASSDGMPWESDVVVTPPGGNRWGMRWVTTYPNGRIVVEGWRVSPSNYNGGGGLRVLMADLEVLLWSEVRPAKEGETSYHAGTSIRFGHSDQTARNEADERFRASSEKSPCFRVPEGSVTRRFTLQDLPPGLEEVLRKSRTLHHDGAGPVPEDWWKAT